VDTFKGSLRRGDIPVTQVEGQSFGGQGGSARHIWMLEQSLDLAGKDQHPCILVVVQRFFAQPVAGQQQLLPVTIPQGQREHPAQVVQHVRPFAAVKRQHRFSVIAGAQVFTLRCQARPQRRVVVDLTVVSQR